VDRYHWLSEVADQIADGTPIDWEALNARPLDPVEEELVERLRALEQVIRQHLVATASSPSSPDDLGHLESPPTEPIPATWGALKIVERIGHGTFGDVYRAYDPRLDRIVALKLLRRRDDGKLTDSDAVIEEGRLLAKLRHPNIVTIYGAERINGQVGIWMEFIEGHTLADELRTQQRLSLDSVISIGTAVCAALSAMHHAGVLHRDIKAQNVIRAKDGRIVLADFGAGVDVLGPMLTNSRRRLAGTPAYLAPEVLQGSPATKQSDVYSLGVLLGYLATGSFEDVRQIATAGRRERRIGRGHSKQLSTRFQSILQRAVSSHPAKRYQTADDLWAALNQYQGRQSGLQVWTWSLLALGLALLVTIRWFSGTAPLHRLVATAQSEPKTFNRFVSSGAAEELFSRLTQAPLIRLNRVTGELEPWLASSWMQSSPDGRVWTLQLRQGVQFSDGAPFSSADVQFTFQALYDKQVASPLASTTFVANQPLEVRAVDDHTVVLTFPAPYGPGLSLLDAIPILPQHKLQKAYAAGKFREAWGLGTPPADLAGLGPFVLREIVRGQRQVYARNPRYWRRDKGGGTLPRLDELEVQLVPDQHAATLRLESGAADLTSAPVRPDDLAELKQFEATGSLSLLDAGVSVNPDGLWFNLAPGAPKAKERPWLQREELRQAISLSVDRQAFADAVFLGEATPIFGPITSGNHAWSLPAWFLPMWSSPDGRQPARDPARARALLASIGLTDHNGDGMLEDAAGRPARFSINTLKGQTILERSVAVLREQLATVGLGVDSVALEHRALIETFSNGQYEAMYFYVVPDSFDPARSAELWMSSGDFHLWQPNERSPASPWEAQIDDLMRRESTTVDQGEQKRLFAEVQRILAQHEPIIYFAAPTVTVAISNRVQGATPSVLEPLVLWNAEMLSVAPSRSGSSRQ
jgi:peptide/nickel transport system substrate-binding protein